MEWREHVQPTGAAAGDMARNLNKGPKTPTEPKVELPRRFMIDGPADSRPTD